MGNGAGNGSGGDDAVPEFADALEKIATSLATATEADRFHALTAFVSALARAGAGDGRERGAAEELGVTKKKTRALQEELATLRDGHAALSADLEHRTAQLKAEETRARKFEKLAEEQRGRLAEFQRQILAFEDRLRVSAGELDKTQSTNEDLVLKLQRLELQKGNTGNLDALAKERTRLNEQIASLRAESERVREGKQREIEDLRRELSEAKAHSARKVAPSIADVWERLATVKPPLVVGPASPPPQSATRLADLLVGVVQTIDEFDKLIRPFVSKYTKSNPQVRIPWDHYAKGQALWEVTREVLSANAGRPVGVVNTRLRALYAWTQAAMIASDVAFESIGSEMQAFLMGPHGAGPEPNRTIKQFLRSDGAELFGQHISQLRSTKLAEAFGRVG